MKPEVRVITTLCERLKLEQQIRALLALRSEDELVLRAKHIAESGEQVIPLLLSQLEKSDPRQVNVLGTVASLYPDRQELLSGLYQAAADVARPDRARVSAMLILERFLGQKLDPQLMHSLNDPRAVAVESVKEMLAAGAEDPALMMEYVRALSEQPNEAISGVVETLIQAGREQAVPMLCQLAQAETEGLAALALKALGQIRHPDAVQGLQALIPLLPPCSRTGGERALLKLQLAGVPVPVLPAVSPAWRALISPVDGMGSRVVWFIRDAGPDDTSLFLGLSLDDRHGILKAYGSHSVPASALPGRERPGHIHRVPMQSVRAPKAAQGAPTSILHMLEANFDHGRRLVREAQLRTCALGRPLPDTYRLLGMQIWQYDTQALDRKQQMPTDLVLAADLLPKTANLPYHPFFLGWFVGGEKAARLARQMAAQGAAVDPDILHTFACRLAESYFDRPTCEQMQTRLRAMSEWLWETEQLPLVELAMTAAETVVTIPPARHPLLLSMAELGLNLIIRQPQSF